MIDMMIRHPIAQQVGRQGNLAGSARALRLRASFHGHWVLMIRPSLFRGAEGSAEGSCRRNLGAHQKGHPQALKHPQAVTLKQSSLTTSKLKSQ